MDLSSGSGTIRGGGMRRKSITGDAPAERKLKSRLDEIVLEEVSV